MPGLIGGSGSTGSSLLRQLLNRHPQLFCGPETSLFCKPQLFDNWEKTKHRILKRGISGLRSNSWHMYRGTDLLKEELGFSKSLISGLIKQSSSFTEFAGNLFSVALDKNEKSFWLEKTPGNAYNFERFLNAFPNGKVIHIYRNPYDAVASMFKRGFSHFDAVAIYLLNTSLALHSKDHPNYCQLSYESLVSEPKKTLTEVCEFLGFDFHTSMLSNSGKEFSDDPHQIGEWSYRESGEIGKSSVGKFSSLDQRDQRIIIFACQAIMLNEDTSYLPKLHYKTIKRLTKELDYSFLSKPQGDFYSLLKTQERASLVQRAKKLAYFNYLNYPVHLTNLV